jgi:hypothetical protein
MESNSGFKRLLKSRFGYRLFQDLVGSNKAAQKIVETYIGDSTGLAVVDIGSGDSSFLRFINPISYTAIEPNSSYLDSATRTFGDRLTPLNMGVGDPRLNSLDLRADLVLILGVLHHLDDNLASTCLDLARRFLKNESGKVVILEAVFTPKQNPIARFLIRNDRGKNVRTQQEYEQLIKPVFDSFTVEIRTDLLNIPYTHFICTATRG